MKKQWTCYIVVSGKCEPVGFGKSRDAAQAAAVRRLGEGLRCAKNCEGFGLECDLPPLTPRQAGAALALFGRLSADDGESDSTFFYIEEGAGGEVPVEWAVVLGDGADAEAKKAAAREVARRAEQDRLRQAAVAEEARLAAANKGKRLKPYASSPNELAD